ncbi:hypothetical protein BTVI_27336 [Pitangus sulphuratus]|nr:hypothetical protein BTVI_27336 [Pitangus sulphuratus]
MLMLWMSRGRNRFRHDGVRRNVLSSPCRGQDSRLWAGHPAPGRHQHCCHPSGACLAQVTPEQRRNHRTITEYSELEGPPRTVESNSSVNDPNP